MPRISVQRDHAGWRAVPRAETLARRAAESALAAAGAALRPDAEISILLTGDDAVRDLNARWRGKDRPTNVLSFPAAAPGGLAGARAVGDVVVACETLLDEARREGKSPADHLRHLVAHGVLHLLGYDHETDAEAQIMEDLERRALAALGVADPYALLDAALDA